MTKIGILHPGEMGISIAASAINSGHQIYWASHDRSDKTCERAEKYYLQEIKSLTQLCEISEIILSVCPPHAAEDTANSVVKHRFEGYYLDANAISPQRAIRIGQMLKPTTSILLTVASSADLRGNQKRLGYIYREKMQT